MGQFALSIEAFADATSEEIDEYVKESVRTIFASLVIKSPVLSGKFRANWNVSLYIPSYVTTARTDKMPFGSPPSSDAMARVNAMLDAWTGEGSIFISNGLPYAARLDSGYSKQAPSGMVDITLIEYKAIHAKEIIRRL